MNRMPWRRLTWDAARLLTLRAAVLKDHKQRYEKEAAMAKLYCSEVMYRCANHAVQLHGGYGYASEYGIERAYRDARLATIGGGLPRS
jgi:alkylation response protein AidB-like acyl-CoA dehydrogenase